MPIAIDGVLRGFSQNPPAGCIRPTTIFCPTGAVQYASDEYLHVHNVLCHKLLAPTQSNEDNPGPKEPFMSPGGVDPRGTLSTSDVMDVIPRSNVAGIKTARA